MRFLKAKKERNTDLLYPVNKIIDMADIVFICILTVSYPE